MPVLEAVSTALLATAPPATVPDARVSVAVYCPTTCDPAAVLALGEDLAGQLTPKAALPRGAAKQPSFVMAALPTEEFGRPGAETLDSYGIGLTTEDTARLAASQEVVVVEAAAPRAQALAVNLALNREMAAFAAKADGVLEDLESRELFSQVAWADQRIAALEEGRLQDLFRVEVYGDGELDRLATHGLVKLGLHELVVEQVYGDFADDLAAATVLMAAHALAHGPFTGEEVTLELAAVKSGATRSWLEGFLCAAGEQAGSGKATLSFVAVDPREHDGDAPIARPVFGDASLEPIERLGTFLDELWGYGCGEAISEIGGPAAEPDATAGEAPLAIPAGPPGEPSAEATAPLPAPTLEQARAEAQEALLGSVKTRWQAGELPAGTRLVVKGPFHGPEEALEWMWVEVAVWEAGLLQGELLNEPEAIPDRHAGDAVVVAEDEAFDYLLVFPDGREEGALTEALLPP